jgi:hypothetical protein
MAAGDGLVIRDADNRITVFGGAAGTGGGVTHFENAAAGKGITVSAWRDGAFLDRVVIVSDVDLDVRVLNSFRAELVAVSDDIKTGRFGDFIQKLQSCARGGWVKVSLRKGVTYTITSIL